MWEKAEKKIALIRYALEMEMEYVLKKPNSTTMYYVIQYTHTDYLIFTLCIHNI